MNITQRLVHTALVLILLVLTGAPFAFDAAAQDGGALLQDDFNDPASGWDSFDLTGCRAAYDGGAFWLEVKSDWRWCYARLHPNDAAWFLGDTALEIGVTAQGTGGYAGVAFRLAGQYRFYAFVVRPSTGDYALWRSDGPRTDWVPLVNWSPLPGAAPGRERVRLGVTMQAGTLALSADGVGLTTVQDYTLAGGWIALIAGRSEEETAAGQSAIFAFDNALLRELEAGNVVPHYDRIAFYTDTENGSEIFTVRPDGGDLRQLTANTANDWYPAWSPDGQRIAFYSDRDGNGEIYVMNADGSGVERLTYDSAEDEVPDWSPDGGQIVFASERNGRRDIYVMNADGTNVRALTADDAPDYNPSWSPDGTQVAFISSRDGTFEIYLMNADGSNIRRLTENAYREWGAAWSPDGTRLAFHADPTFSGNSDLFLLDVKGGEPVMITEGARDERFPAWSPDGRQIVFMSGYREDFDLYILDVGAPPGTPYHRVTAGPADDWWPDWTAGDTALPAPWVASPPGGAPACLAISTGGKDLNLRAGPGTQYPTIGTLQGDQPVPVLGYRGDWYALALADQQQGWVARWLVGLAGPCDRLVYVLLPGERPTGEAGGAGTPLPPTPTPVPGGPIVSFTADGRSITYLGLYECADIAWNVSNASEVYYQDRPVGLRGTALECPTQPGVYVYGLRVVNAAGNFNYTVTVEVEMDDEEGESQEEEEEVEPTEPPEPTETPPAEPCGNPSGVCIALTVNGASYQEVCPSTTVNVAWRVWGYVNEVFYSVDGSERGVGPEDSANETVSNVIGTEHEYCVSGSGSRGEQEACVYVQVIECP